jgi:hypothetical protein
MTTLDFIIDLFCRIDDQMRIVPKHPQAQLWPSEVVTVGVLHALKGTSTRAFYRWLLRDYQILFPRLPERTRLFRLFKRHWRWMYLFLASPTVLGVVDSYGIELLHPIREGRSRSPLGRKGKSTHRWIMGVKLCVLLNQVGLVVGWVWAPANTHDSEFHPLVQAVNGRMVVLGDTGFHAQAGDPDNFKLCQRGEWNERMRVETVLAMLTSISHLKRVSHRVAAYVRARLAFTGVAFNVLVQWHGLVTDEHGFIPLSIAEFSL